MTLGRGRGGGRGRWSKLDRAREGQGGELSFLPDLLPSSLENKGKEEDQEEEN